MVREVQSAGSACCAVQVSIFPEVAQKSSTPSRSIVTSLRGARTRLSIGAAVSSIYRNFDCTPLKWFFSGIVEPRNISSWDALVRSGSRQVSPTRDPHLSRSVQELIGGASRTSSAGSSSGRQVRQFTQRTLIIRGPDNNIARALEGAGAGSFFLF